MEVKYTVTVKDSTGLQFDFSKVGLYYYGNNGIVLDYSEQPDPEKPGSFAETTLAPQNVRATYTFVREDSTEAHHVDSGGRMNHSIDIIQEFYNSVYVNGWYPTAETKYEDKEAPIDRMEKVTITNIRLEALDNSTDDVIAGPYDYKCNIKILPQATQMKADAENALVYDPATDTLTFNGLHNGKANDYYARVLGNFVIDGWPTLCWRLDKKSSEAMSYIFPVASNNNEGLQEKLRNGEQVTAEFRTIGGYVGGYAGGPGWLSAGEAELYIEYVEGVKSVVKDSVGI